jgi:hypothetical protein
MFRASLLAPILVSIVASMASAQPQDSPPRTSLLKKGFLGIGVEPGLALKSHLLRLPAIQEEIKLTPAQQARLKAAEAEVERVSALQRQERRKMLQELRAQGDTQALEAMNQKSLADAYSITPESDKPLMRILDRRQLTRMEQIQFQVEGPHAFTHPQVQERLNLTPEQIQMIGTILDQSRAETDRAATVPAEVLPDGRFTPEQRAALMESKKTKAEIDKGREAVLKTRQTTMRVLAKALTKGQRERYQKMIGEPFDFAKLRPENAAKSQEPKP